MIAAVDDPKRSSQRLSICAATDAWARDYTEQTATEQKNIKVDSIMAQAQEDESNAAYLRQASKTALLGGDLGAVGNVLKGIGPALPALALA